MIGAPGVCPWSKLLEKIPFSLSPLITAERLLNDIAHAFDHHPDWAKFVERPEPGSPISESIVVLKVKDDVYDMSSVSAAFLFELTRYGHNVFPNRNRPSRAKEAERYLRVQYVGRPTRAGNVSRLVLGIGKREESVLMHGPRHLHPHDLKIKGGGKPTRLARNEALEHARRQAQKFISGLDLDTYMTNLGALFELHDQIFKVTPMDLEEPNFV